MKKNNMLRIASVLLVAVLLSTCAISGAFAKYTTSGTATDSARVAKFGITVTATGDTFHDEYDDLQGDGIVIGNAADGAGLSVQADEAVVAPGTEGTLVAFTIGGTAEVATKVTYSVTDAYDESMLVLTGWEVDGVEYCPLVFKVGTTPYSIDGHNITDIEGLITAVTTAIEDYTATYAAGATVGNADGFAVSWSWPISVDDEKDTDLGRAAFAGNGPTISLTVNATVDQID